MDEKFTEHARKVKDMAANQARRLRHAAIKSEHLMHALLHTGPNLATVAIEKAGIGGKIRETIDKVLTDEKPAAGPVEPQWDVHCRQAFERAAAEAEALGHASIGTEHLFLGLLAVQDTFVCDMLHKAGIEYLRLRDDLQGALQVRSGDLAVELRVKQRADCKDLPLPAYMSKAASGMDLAAAVTADVTLEPGKFMLVPTGISIALPFGYEAQVRPRSGLALKHGITIVNAPGTIDSDYRGEIGVILANMGQEPFVVKRGMRIAQMVVAPVVQARLIATDDLDSTTRNDGGFGHTGA